MLSRFLNALQIIALSFQYRLKIGIFAPTGSVSPEISNRRGGSQPFFLSCGMWTQVSFVLSQITRLTDRRTNRRTDGQHSHVYTAVCCILQSHGKKVAQLSQRDGTGGCILIIAKSGRLELRGTIFYGY